MRRIALSIHFVLSAAPCLAASCWEEAAQRYGVSPLLLRALAQVESGLNPLAVNRSHVQRTSSYDIGLMQINSSNLAGLSRFGIKESDLYDACTNIHVGAWLLSQRFSRHGINWEAVGAYNAACTRLKGENCQRARREYAWRVYRRLPDQSAAVKAGTTSASAASLHTATIPQPVILSARVSP